MTDTGSEPAQRVWRDPAAMPAPEWLRPLGSTEGEHSLTDREGIVTWLKECYRAPKQRWVRMNMLGSLNGRVTGPDGTSDSLSNRADRRILRTIRSLSDAVVVGAQTVRQERHATTRPTRLCVITSSGDLAGHRIHPDDAAELVYVCTVTSARERVHETMPGANIITLGTDDSGQLRLSDVIAELGNRGMHQLVVEGGGQLISQFLDAGLLDEICLTQAPVFGPSDAPTLPSSTLGTAFARELVLEDSLGYLYQRLFASTSRP